MGRWEERKEVRKEGINEGKTWKVIRRGRRGREEKVEEGKEERMKEEKMAWENNGKVERKGVRGKGKKMRKGRKGREEKVKEGKEERPKKKKMER